MRRHLGNSDGFSIIEVLIGAVVFMIGFSALILLLDNVFLKFSVKELESANSLGSRLMNETVVTGDTTHIDSTFMCSGLRLKAIRNIELNERLVCVDITVSRESTGKQIVRIYNEVFVPEK